MRILLWHVHGSWTTAFVQGEHDVPRARRCPTAAPTGAAAPGPGTGRRPSSRCTPPSSCATSDVDVVVLQRPHELERLARRGSAAAPGRDVPAIYLEHNAPQGRIAEMRHPAADRDDLALVPRHPLQRAVLGLPARTPTRVIEHGIVDPGPRYTGELPRAARGHQRGAPARRASPAPTCSAASRAARAARPVRHGRGRDRAAP